jgi:PadR family transcriptional regulator PadR
MEIENVKAQMRKGILEYCVLNIISRGEIYPSDILKTLKAAELLVVEGTLYPLLTRLKNGGLLTYTWVESRSGPPRKYYRLTPIGEQFLAELETTWQELSAAIQLTTTHQPSTPTQEQAL